MPANILFSMGGGIGCRLYNIYLAPGRYLSPIYIGEGDARAAIGLRSARRVCGEYAEILTGHHQAHQHAHQFRRLYMGVEVGALIARQVLRWTH